MRYIPKSSKVKVTFYKGITVADLLIGLAALALIALTLSTNFSWRFYLAAGILCLAIALFLPIGDSRAYGEIWHLVRYLFSKKRYRADSATLIPYESIEDDIVYEKDGSAIGTIEISPINFFLLSEQMQDALIDGCLERVLCLASEGEEWSLVKLDVPIVLDARIEDEMKRLETLSRMKEKGELSEAEYRSRCDLIQSSLNRIDSLNSSDSKEEAIYLVLNGWSGKSVREKLDRAEDIFAANGMKTTRLKGAELDRFLRAGFGKSFDPRDEMITIPSPESVKFSPLSFQEDGILGSTYLITRFPSSVPNGWLAGLCSLSKTKTVMRMKPVPKAKAVHRIDAAILELETKRVGKESQLQESDAHLETLRSLLEDLQQSDETLFDVTLLVTAYEEGKGNANRKAVKDSLREMGFGFSDLFGRQQEGYVSSFPSEKNLLRNPYGIQSSALAACFPFCQDMLEDEGGILIGENAKPAFLNPFKRDLTHVNSNMVVIGQSGSGKSYAVKTLLSNLATEGERIYVLDPESEYGNLARNLGGAVIDASDGSKGRVNPFQIDASMDEDGGSSNSYYAQLQFLEQFYKTTLIGINQDSLELLNRLTEEIYAEKGIRPGMNLAELKPEDYPTFEDLVSLTNRKLKESKDAYEENCLRVLANYLSRFRKGGRDSALWNGMTTLSAKENFVAFDFQRLLANKNDSTANAQMLLLLRYLENEVIRNKKENERNGTHRKIVVAIDEAHLFIDEKYPIALDFMYSLAKRIRKYDGMLIIITQNVRDFAGTPEIARKSTAIINVSQYSMIFALPPNDMNELLALYQNSGGINEAEREAITHNPRGACFLISSPSERGCLSIEATEAQEDCFGEGTR